MRCACSRRCVCDIACTVVRVVLCIAAHRGGGTDVWCGVCWFVMGHTGGCVVCVCLLWVRRGCREDFVQKKIDQQLAEARAKSKKKDKRGASAHGRVRVWYSVGPAVQHAPPPLSALCLNCRAAGGAVCARWRLRRGRVFFSGAMMCLKRKKLYEKEIAKYQGARLTLEQQIITLESATVNVETFRAMRTGATAMEQIHGELYVVLCWACAAASARVCVRGPCGDRVLGHGGSRWRCRAVRPPPLVLNACGPPSLPSCQV